MKQYIFNIDNIAAGVDKLIEAAGGATNHTGHTSRALSKLVTNNKFVFGCDDSDATGIKDAFQHGTLNETARERITKIKAAAAAMPSGAMRSTKRRFFQGGGRLHVPAVVCGSQAPFIRRTVTGAARPIVKVLWNVSAPSDTAPAELRRRALVVAGYIKAAAASGAVELTVCIQAKRTKTTTALVTMPIIKAGEPVTDYHLFLLSEPFLFRGILYGCFLHKDVGLGKDFDSGYMVRTAPETDNDTIYIEALSSSAAEFDANFKKATEPK